MEINNISGYVYLIGTQIFGWYKIGKSKTPEIRIRDLGILLPFKIDVFGVWAAHNHHLLETTLHEKFLNNRINGEWFEFSRDKVIEVFSFIPEEARIYPVVNKNQRFDMFSNIAEDRKRTADNTETRRVIGVRCEKLRGNFTPKERAEKRAAGIIKHQKRKEEREAAKSYKIE